MRTWLRILVCEPGLEFGKRDFMKAQAMLSITYGEGTSTSDSLQATFTTSMNFSKCNTPAEKRSSVTSDKSKANLPCVKICREESSRSGGILKWGNGTSHEKFVTSRSLGLGNVSRLSGVLC